MEMNLLALFRSSSTLQTPTLTPLSTPSCSTQLQIELPLQYVRSAWDSSDLTVPSSLKVLKIEVESEIVYPRELDTGVLWGLWGGRIIPFIRGIEIALIFVP